MFNYFGIISHSDLKELHIGFCPVVLVFRRCIIGGTGTIIYIYKERTYDTYRY